MNKFKLTPFNSHIRIHHITHFHRAEDNKCLKIYHSFNAAVSLVSVPSYKCFCILILFYVLQGQVRLIDKNLFCLPVSLSVNMIYMKLYARTLAVVTGVYGTRLKKVIQELLKLIFSGC